MVKSYAVVSAEEAAVEPYPYVWVDDDGSVCELNSGDKEYLETVFNPMDGARPYLKHSWDQRDGSGCFSGYIAREKVPQGTPISSVPRPDDSQDDMISPEEFMKRFEESREK